MQNKRSLITMLGSLGDDLTEVQVILFVGKNSVTEFPIEDVRLEAGKIVLEIVED